MAMMNKGGQGYGGKHPNPQCAKVGGNMKTMPHESMKPDSMRRPPDHTEGPKTRPLPKARWTNIDGKR